MYKTSLFFKLRDNGASEKHRVLEMFFKSWVDDACNNEVDYTLEETKSTINPKNCIEIYRVDFENTEDAVALKLTGVPKEFQHYIELVF